MCPIRNSRWLAAVSVIIIFALASACATLGKNKNTKEELATAVEAFNTALRWGDFKLASAFIAPALQEQFWRQSDIMEDRIRLTEYDIRHVTWKTSGGPLPVILRWRYYCTNNPNLKTETVRQVWLYSEEIGNWQVTQSGLEALVDH